MTPIGPPRARLAALKKPEEHNGLRHTSVWSPGDSLPNDLFAYGREAARCFMDRRYIASITMASASVELILNKDSRMRIGRNGWQPLSAKLMRQAAKGGLPVHHLLGPGETFETDKSTRFVFLRNQLAHGNLETVIEFRQGGATDYNPEARLVALRQINKSERFAVEWFNSAPDVQHGLIKGGHWVS